MFVLDAQKCFISKHTKVLGILYDAYSLIMYVCMYIYITIHSHAHIHTHTYVYIQTNIVCLSIYSTLPETHTHIHTLTELINIYIVREY